MFPRGSPSFLALGLPCVSVFSSLHHSSCFASMMQQETHLRSLLEAMTRSQSLTLCFLRNFLVKYLRYLRQGGRFSIAHLALCQDNSDVLRARKTSPSAYLFDM